MRILILVTLAGCGGHPEPLTNTSITSPRPAVGLSGVMIDATTGAPIVGVTLLLNPLGQFAATDGVAPDGKRHFAEAISDATGTYRFASVAPGRYDLRMYYADISIHRVITVTALPTQIHQRIATDGASSGTTLECTGEAVATCK